MPRKRADSFKIAVEALREELRSGVHTPGTRLTANEIAERLSLSQTPVREALSRLAGEGLLQDRRGQGFFVPRLSEADLAVLFRLQEELLLMTCEADRPPLPEPDLDQLMGVDRSGLQPRDLPVATERLFRVLAATASPPLARHLGRLHDQLAAARTAEPEVLDGLPEAFRNLADAVAAGGRQRIREALARFFARRIQAAAALAGSQDRARI